MTDWLPGGALGISLVPQAPHAGRQTHMSTGRTHGPFTTRVETERYAATAPVSDPTILVSTRASDVIPV